MARVKFSNFASARLATAVDSITTSFTVATGEGAEFPTIVGDETFYAVVVEGQGSNVEIVRATARAGDRITVERGVGGTIARSWTANAVLELRPLAEAFDELQSNIRSSRGALIATSGTLPTTVAVGANFQADWTLEPNVPAGVRAFNSYPGNSDWVELPALRPFENVTGVWVVALVDDVEISEMFVTWGGSGTIEDSQTAERVVGALKFVEAIPATSGSLTAPPVQMASFIDVVLLVRRDYPTFIRFGGDGHDIPANSTAKMYWAVSGGSVGGGDRSLESTSPIDAGAVVVGATDGTREVREATGTDLTALAGELADPARGVNELALKTELGSVASGMTDLGVQVEASQVTVTSSTGSDAVLTGASTTEAGVLTSTDKAKVDNALAAAATIDAGKVVMGATDGSRAVREATATDLNTLASDLADGARGAAELALKSELGSGGGGGGVTNLSVTRAIGSVTVRSSTGTDAVLDAASTTEAGVMPATDKTRLNNALTANATIDSGKFVAGRQDGTRNVREASDADLDGLAGDLADGARGANELALKTEIPSVPADRDTNLSITRDATEVTVASSTGTDATIPAASGTQAGTLTGTDKTRLDRTLESAAVVNSGSVVVGAGSRNVRGATDADLDSLAGEMASGDRGANELALKSELPTVGAGTTNLSVTRTATQVTVASSTGTDAALDGASTTQAGVLTAADKGKVNNALAAAATIDAGKVVMGATDGSRAVREASDADLDSLAGDLASGDRGGNELALKTELPTVNPTNLSVVAGAEGVEVRSSTGTNATISRATTSVAGMMAAADKTALGRALSSTATVNSGKFVAGAGGRAMREATDADLDALAGDLASGDRGTNELALKSEVVAGNTRGDLLATSSTLPTAAVSSGGSIGNTWAVESGAPTGVTSAASSLHLPELRPSDEIDGIWMVSLVDGTEFSEVHIPWGYAGESTNPSNNKYKYSVLKFRDAVVGGHSASFVDVVRLTNSVVLIGVNTALPANATVRVYLSVGAGAAASSGGGGGGGAQATDLSVSQSADNVVIASSTGADATIPAASTTDAGVMSATDKGHLETSVRSTATVNDGDVVVGASAGSRNVRAATAADLTALATSLADGARGDQELALKSELGTGVIRPNAMLIDDETFDVTGATSGDVTATLFDLSRAMFSGAILVFRIYKDVTDSAGPGIAMCLTNEILGLPDGPSTAPSTADFDDALKVLIPRADDHGWGHQALYVWRHTDADKLWIAGGRHQAAESFQVDLVEYTIGGGGASDLSVSRTATQVTVASSTGTDATLPAASTTEAGVLSATDKSTVDTALTAAATIDAGNVVMGATDSSRAVRAASDADLDALAGALADGARGGNELALKTEIGTGGGGATNLSVTRDATEVTVASSTGTDATLPAASGTQAGVMTGADKTRVDRSLEAAAVISSGSAVFGAGSRNVREASDADLDAFAGSLADGARGANELALKSELPSLTTTPTNLGVTVSAGGLTVTSSTGTDASLPAASTTEAGVMTSTDKTKVNNATEAAATIDAGKVVMGASDGSRSVREASDADLDSLAGDLASGDRGGNELALKSELPTGGGGGSPTNLSVSRTGTQVTVASSTGTDAVLPAASTTQAGVMTSTDKSGLNSSVRSTATFDGGKPLMGATDNTRNIRQATIGDLNNLARDLADGARGANELALKSELGSGGGGGGATNLSVTRDANQVTVASSTGTDASLPAASTTEAGVLSATDKGKVDNAAQAVAAVSDGSVVIGGGSRSIREATDADLDALAGSLAAGARGGNELALKSELGAGGGGTTATDLAVTRSASSIVVTSSTGTDATLPAASSSEAGVMSGTDKTRLSQSAFAAAQMSSGSIVASAGGRNVRAATDSDLDSLAGDLAAGARGGNELALKTELPTVSPTDLSVLRGANSVVVQSSTGTNATISRATSGVSGVMSSADKAKVDSAIAAAATINSGSVVTSAGGRNVRAATDSDLDSLAGDLASADRGGNELALKSELASAGGNARGALLATSGTFPTSPSSSGVISPGWTLESNVPTGVTADADGVFLPALRPSDSIDGVWIVALVDGTEISEVKSAWGGFGIEEDFTTFFGAKIGPLRFREGSSQESAIFTDVILRSFNNQPAQIVFARATSTLPANSTVKIYLSVVTGASGAGGGGGGGTTTPTNLGVSRDASNVVVTSSTGTDATLPAASVTQAGVMTSVDKNAVSRALTAAANVDTGQFIAGSSDDSRSVRAATDSDLDSLAGTLAAGARGGNELALKSELPTVSPTNLSVTRAASQVTIASSTGTDAVLPAATATEAGAMSGTDKTKLTNAIESAAVVGSGNFVSGAGGRSVREATAADLTSLAGALAAGARGASELALKSELGAGGNGPVVTLVDDLSFLNAGSNTARIAQLVTLSEDLPPGHFIVFHFRAAGHATLDHTVSGLCISNEIIGLENVRTTAPNTNVSTDALKLSMGRVGDKGFGQENLYIWRHTDANKLWLSMVRDGSVAGIRSDIFAYPIGGSVASSGDVATWAQTGNTDDIPGAKLADAGVAVIANAQADISVFNIGSLVFNLEDQHFYRVLQDRTHAVHPLRAVFAPDDLATDSSSFLVQGYARAAFNPYASAAEGSLAVAPNVQASVPGTLDLVLSVAEPDRSSGTILIGIDSTSSFVPARIKWRAGNEVGNEPIAYDADVSAGVHRYFATTHLDNHLGNVWNIREGQTEDVTVDFDIVDATGVSIAPGTQLRRYLERVNLPGTETGYEGNVSVPYGRHRAPQPQSGILIDTATGDEFYARRVTDPDLVIVEPVQAGVDTYGLAPGNGAAFNAPANLSRLAWDPVTGLVDVEGTATNLDGWKKVSHVADPAQPTGSSRTARLVEVPAASTPLGARRKRALMCDWHSSLARTTAFSSGGTALVSISGTSEFVRYRTSSRKLEMRLTRPRANVDDGQRIGLQRITPEVSSNIHWRCGIQESASDDGTVPTSNLWGDLGGGLHPVWFEWSLRVVGTAAEQRAGSYLEAGHRVLADETMWMIFYFNSELTDDFISIPPTGGPGYNAIKLDHDPTDVTTGSVQRHRYVIADDSPTLPATIYSIPTGTQPWYVGLVITANDATSAGAMVRSLEPVNFDKVEIEGVPIPVTMSERRMVLESGSVTSPLVSSILRTDWESDAYDTGQEAPLAAGQSYAINYSNERGVTGRPYLSNIHPPTQHTAGAFQLLDSADAAEVTTDGARAWWEVRSRGLPRINAPPQEQGAPWRLRRWGDEEHRAVPEQTANDVQGYVMNDPDVSGGFLVTGWSRTVMHQLADGNGSVVLERFEISSVSGGSRFLRIYVATGDSMPSVNMRIENHTQKWIHLTGNVSTTHHNYWQVQILTQGLPIAVGDEIRLRLWAGTHTPIAWNHAVNSWRPV